MSFRELKIFSEIMKSLGYGRLISLDNFRTPNFELVADILYFFCDRIESSIDLSDDISTKLKRVEFIKNCANILASKTQIKLKLKNLYKSDGYAVKELLKIANFLNDANNINPDINPQDSTTTNPTLIANNLQKLREYTNLGSKIVENGVKLHNLLNNNDSNGNYNKIIDERVIRFLDEMSHNIENYDNVIKKNIDKKLNHSINDIDDNINDLQQNKLIEIKENMNILQTKLDDKTNELDRLKKRLSSLKNIKPAFIEEYEVLEAQNVDVYNLYCEKFRNLSYLQSQLNKYRVLEQEKEIKIKKRLKSVQQKLREQEMKLLSNVHDDVDDLDIYEANNNMLPSGDRNSGRGRGSSGRRRSGGGGHGFTESGSITRSGSNTNTTSNTSTGSSSSTGSSNITSPTRSGTDRTNDDEDDASIGSISDIGDEHMQF